MIFIKHQTLICVSSHGRFVHLIYQPQRMWRNYIPLIYPRVPSGNTTYDTVNGLNTGATHQPIVSITTYYAKLLDISNALEYKLSNLAVLSTMKRIWSHPSFVLVGGRIALLYCSFVPTFAMLTLLTCIHILTVHIVQRPRVI